MRPNGAPAQRCGPSPNRNVFVDIGPVQNELVRILEHRFIAIGRRVHQRNWLILENGSSAKFHIVLGGPGKSAVGREQTQIFFDSRRN